MEANGLEAWIRRVAASILVGVVITLLSGLFPSPSSYLLLGAAQWGMPLSWITQVIYPNAPKIFHWSEFTVDVGFWSFIFYASYYRIIKRRQAVEPLKAE
jgi:hypothetical protein